MQDPNADITRRTRRLTRAQSKYGCLTCKSRKVRCDETHPTCRRCTNSGFVCEGYTNTRPVSPSLDTPLPPLPLSNSSLAIARDSLAIPETDVQRKLLRVLQSSSVAYIGREALDNIIRTTSRLAPSSITALPALEVLVQRDSGQLVDEPASRLQVDTAYGQAIRLFVDEIRTNAGSSDAIFITGIILITIELLQRRRQDAWKHLLGSRQWLASSSIHDSRAGDIGFLYRIYDLQSLLYSHNVRAPMIDPIDDNTLEYGNVHALALADFEKIVVNILHSAHVLLSRMHQLDLLGNLPPVKQENEQLCQGRLRTAIQHIDHRLRAKPELQHESAYLILRNLCLAASLELEQSRSTNETSWDKFEEEFQSILEATESIQLHTQSVSPSMSGHGQGQGRLHLTLQLGLSSPLFLTASKYRHPLWRRRAIACLRKTGIEGPFIGKQLAAIADRCVEIEESGIQQPSVSTTSDGLSSLTRLSVRMPAEDKRLAHCRTDEDDGSTDQISWPRTTRGSTLVLFMARRSSAPVLAAKALTSTCFSTSDQYAVLQDKSLDNGVWRVWTETIPFDGFPE